MFDAEQIADMQAEMNRLMRDYPDGNIPPDIIAEWEARAESARMGHEVEDLSAAIESDESNHKTPRTPHTRIPRADKPPADMEPDAQGGDVSVIKLNRADMKLALQLSRLYGLLGLGVTMLNQADGAMILATAETRAQELVLLSNHHPGMKKTLRSLTESNDYLIFAMGHGSLLLAILQNHNVLPQNIGRSIAGLFQRRSTEDVPV